MHLTHIGTYDILLPASRVPGGLNIARAATEPSDLRRGHGAEASPEKGDVA